MIQRDLVPGAQGEVYTRYFTIRQPFVLLQSKDGRFSSVWHTAPSGPVKKRDCPVT